MKDLRIDIYLQQGSVSNIGGFSYFYWGGARNFRGVSREQVTEATQSVTKPQGLYSRGGALEPRGGV